MCLGTWDSTFTFECCLFISHIVTFYQLGFFLADCPVYDCFKSVNFMPIRCVFTLRSLLLYSWFFSGDFLLFKQRLLTC